MNYSNNKVSRISLLLIVVFVLIFSFIGVDIQSSGSSETLSGADIAWMLTASGLVLIMTPGLSFFYGGMVNRKNIISTMLQAFITLGVVSLVWVVVGFSLAFGESVGGIIGNPNTFAFFRNVGLSPNPTFSETIPFLLYALFQMKFAIITPAIIIGSFAERIKFTRYLVFIVFFTLFVYCPLAHWTWHPEGLLGNMGVLDFAGGTVVHMSSGIAALVGAVVLGSRKEKKEKPSNIPFVILGTALLWFGWFGFNAGSSLGANADGVLAFGTTHMASATAMLTWIFMDKILGKKITALNTCIGAVVGLVAITPAAGFVTISHSIFIGAIAAIVCNLAMKIQLKSKVDDTLSVFPCHGIGGIVGMILTGIFAKEVGLYYGEYDTFWSHLKAVVIVFLFVAIVSYVILKVVNAIVPLRVSDDDENEGLDISQHGECYQA